MNDYCPHYHIDNGEQFCWAVIDNLANYRLSVFEIQRLTRKCNCYGTDKLCDFKKVGENPNERL